MFFEYNSFENGFSSKYCNPNLNFKTYLLTYKFCFRLWASLKITNKIAVHSPVWSSVLAACNVQSTITTTLLNALRVEPVWHFLTLNWARASSVGWMVAGWLFQPWVCKVQQHQHEALGWWVVTKIVNKQLMIVNK